MEDHDMESTVMRVLFFLCNAPRTFTRVLGWKINRNELDQFEGDLDQIVFACEKCNGIDECHCNSPGMMLGCSYLEDEIKNYKESLFDSLEYRRDVVRLGEILREAGMDENEIEMFRTDHDTLCRDCGYPHTSIKRHVEFPGLVFFLAERQCKNCGNEWLALEPLSNLDPSENHSDDKIAKIKESMKNGYLPPEDRSDE